MEFEEEIKEEPFQLIIKIGAKSIDALEREFEEIISELEFRKPTQGTYIGSDYMLNVSTPKWNGEKY